MFWFYSQFIVPASDVLINPHRQRFPTKSSDKHKFDQKYQTLTDNMPIYCCFLDRPAVCTDITITCKGRVVTIIMDTSIVAGRQKEQKHQAYFIFTPRLYPHQSYANHDISCSFTAAAESVCNSWALRRHNQEAPSPLFHDSLPTLEKITKSICFTKLCIVLHIIY